MGTWESGNFDNDTAMDHLYELVAPLLEQIRQTVADESLMEPDEYDSEVMLCNVEILCVLAEGLGNYSFRKSASPVVAGEFPTPDEVREWRTKYLAIWDSYIDELEPEEEYRRQRRLVIEESFDRFAALAERVTV